MSAITKYVCDICGKEYKKEDLSSVPVLVHLVSKKGEDVGIDCIQTDACRECLGKYLALTWRYLAEFTKHPDGTVSLKENLASKPLPRNVSDNEIKIRVRDYINKKAVDYVENQVASDFEEHWGNKYTNKKTIEDRQSVFNDGVNSLYQYFLEDNVNQESKES